VLVPCGLSSDDAITQTVDYYSQSELPTVVPVPESDGFTLIDLRDAIVDAAKAQGKITATVPPNEFILRVRTLGKEVSDFHSNVPVWLRTTYQQPPTVSTSDPSNMHACGKISVG
jgi:hypothetical protein